MNPSRSSAMGYTLTLVLDKPGCPRLPVRRRPALFGSNRQHGARSWRSVRPVRRRVWMDARRKRVPVFRHPRARVADKSRGRADELRASPAARAGLGARRWSSERTSAVGLSVQEGVSGIDSGRYRARGAGRRCVGSASAATSRTGGADPCWNSCRSGRSPPTARRRTA